MCFDLGVPYVDLKYNVRDVNQLPLIIDGLRSEA
jgi:hypothetical protein